MGELPTPAAGHGLVGTAAEETKNMSLAMLASKLGGVGQREDMVVKPWMRRIEWR